MESNVLDLFCGAGGFSLGFAQAGFNIVAGIDNSKDAIKTYAHNLTKATAMLLDLSKEIDFYREDLSVLLNTKIDVIIGGPPCQGFSIAGKRLVDDPRNKLYKAYLAMIEKYSPKAVVMENVPTILSLFQGKVSDAIKDDFHRMNYKTTVFTLLASEYGVPQKRRRTFFVALKSGNDFVLPTPTTLFNPITTSSAISDLEAYCDDGNLEIRNYMFPAKTEYQRLMRKGSTSLNNHWMVQHTEQTKQIIALVPDGGNYKDLPVELRDTRRVNIAWTRMNSEEPCFTIDAGHNHHFHYKANRVPTVRECSRIQSFPDTFRFLGGKVSQFRQVGNAVPPLLAKVIACQLKGYI